jgi:hypothetical protein
MHLQDPRLNYDAPSPHFFFTPSLLQTQPAQTRRERAQDYRYSTYLYTLRAVLHATGQCIGGGVKNAVDCAYLYFTDVHGFIVIK